MKKEIPDSLKWLLFAEADYQCAWCGCRKGLNPTIHHIRPREHEGPTEYDNLVALCPDCHELATKGDIAQKDVRRIKRHLVHRLFTPPGVNAAKIAYRHPQGLVPVHPYVIQHLLDLGFFKHRQKVEGVEFGEPRVEVTLLALYELTQSGRAIVEKWLLRTDDMDEPGLCNL